MQELLRLRDEVADEEPDALILGICVVVALLVRGAFTGLLLLTEDTGVELVIVGLLWVCCRSELEVLEIFLRDAFTSPAEVEGVATVVAAAAVGVEGMLLSL